MKGYANLLIKKKDKIYFPYEDTFCFLKNVLPYLQNNLFPWVAMVFNIYVEFVRPLTLRRLQENLKLCLKHFSFGKYACDNFSLLFSIFLAYLY